MDKNKQQILILVAVIVVFFALLFGTFLRSKGKQKDLAVKISARSAGSPAVKKTQAPSAPKKSSFQNWGRDPFSVGSAPILVSGDLSLSGIIWDAKKPLCLIDGKVVKVGDEISGAKVLEIAKDSVTIKVGDEIRVLRIGR